MCMIDDSREIISVEKNEAVFVNRLICVSDIVNEIYGDYLKKFSKFTLDKNVKEMFIFSRPECLKYIRENVFRTLQISEKNRPSRMIFLVRERNDRLMNETEVAKFLKGHGFEIVNTDKLGFEEEVRLFHDSKILISTVGGAMTNLVYCSKKTKAVCIWPHRLISAVAFYTDVAANIGFDFYCQDAKIGSLSSSCFSTQFVLTSEMCKEMSVYGRAS